MKPSTRPQRRLHMPHAFGSQQIVTGSVIGSLSITNPNRPRLYGGQGTSIEYIARPSWLPSVVDAHAVDHNALFATDAYLAEVASRLHRVNYHREAILGRLAILRDDAAEDGEPYSDLSAEFLIAFLDDLVADERAAIGLGSGGNLQAVWQNDRQDRIAIQFFPDGRLQYVVLRDRDGRTYDSSGHDTAATIKGIVGALGLSSLWFHGEG